MVRKTNFRKWIVDLPQPQWKHGSKKQALWGLRVAMTSIDDRL